MKLKNKILDLLRIMIENNDSQLSNLIIENQNEIFNDNEISDFIISLSSKLDFNNYYTISGSGGSKINKPNITSIAFLYIASIGIPIIKTGSRAITGLYGSTDFFEELNLLNVSINNDKYSFAYYDGYSVSKWKKHKNLLSLNKSFADYFNKFDCHDFQLKSKISIQLEEKNVRKYLEKNMLRKPKKLFVINNKGKLGLDEVYGEDIYVNTEYVYTFVNKAQFNKILSCDEIKKINFGLICGENDKNDFWYNCLKYEVAMFLYLNDFVKTISDGEIQFENLYDKKTVKHMMRYCGLKEVI